MNKKLLIIISFLAIFTISNIPLLEYANAEYVGTDYYLIDWDDFNLGSIQGSGSFYNWISPEDDFYVYNGYVNSSPRCLYSTIPDGSLPGESDHFNTYLSVGYVNSIMIDLRVTDYNQLSSTYQHYINIAFYNGTTQLAYLRIKSNAGSPEGTSVIYYNYTTSTWDTLYTDGLENLETKHYQIGLFKNPDDELVSFGIKDISEGGSWIKASSEPQTNNIWNNVTRIYIGSYRQAVGYLNTWVDNINISTDTTIEYVDPVCGFFGCDEDLTIGSSIPTGGESKRFGLSPYLGGYYKFGSAVTLKNISLTLSSIMDYDILTQIQCKVNEHTIGIPSSICYDDSGRYAVLTWNEVIDVAQCPFIIFSFYNPTPTSGKYWLLYVSNDDLNGDGIKRWFNYDSSSVWDNHNVAYPAVRDWVIDSDKELYIRFCADYSFSVDCISDLEESLIVQPSMGCTNEPFEITYSLLADDFCTGLPCYIYVNKSGVIQDIIALSSQQGKIVYYPEEEGTYYFNMTTDGSLAISRNILINCISDFYVKTIPNPSITFQVVTIHYLYNSLLQGRIEIINDKDEIIKYVTISPESNGSFSHAFNKNGIYYIRLYVNVTEYLLKELIHYVGETGLTLLTSNKQTYVLGQTITLSYQHGYVGENVYIAYSSGELIKNIGDSSMGTYSFKANKTGVLRINLLLKRGDGYPEIKSYCIITVSEPQPVFGMIIESPWSWFLGIFICVFFMLLPFFIKTIFKLTDDIPMLFYIITTCVGVVISVLFGFFPIWVPFFILFIAILIIVIMWMKGKTGISSE